MLFPFMVELKHLIFLILSTTQCNRKMEDLQTACNIIMMKLLFNSKNRDKSTIREELEGSVRNHLCHLQGLTKFPLQDKALSRIKISE